VSQLSDDLKKVLGMLTPAAWIKGNYATDARGRVDFYDDEGEAQAILVADPRACKWCLLGMVCLAAGAEPDMGIDDPGFARVKDMVQALISVEPAIAVLIPDHPSLNEGDLIRWNDTSERTLGEVRDRVTCAISLEEVRP
jgi:hypothetical protein